MLQRTWDAVSDFVDAHPECWDGSRVSGSCSSYSMALQPKIPGSKIIRVSGFLGRAPDCRWRMPPCYWSHTALWVDGMVVDLTARQFDESFDVPRITTIEELQREWMNIRVEA